MKNSIMIAGIAALTLAACEGEAGGSANAADAAANGSEPSLVSNGPCADDGARLPITGICVGRANAYLAAAGGTSPEAPEGCEWAVQETRVGDQVLLYRASKCGSKATRLGYAEKAPLAELSYDSLAYGDPDNQYKGTVVARVGGVDGADKTAALTRIAREAIQDPAEKSGCRARNAGIDSWPEDSIVVDVPDPVAADAAADGPRAACGPFGFNGDEASYWRVFGGKSWFFQLGQDIAQIDPASFTLLTKDPAGGWTQVD